MTASAAPTATSAAAAAAVADIDRRTLNGKRSEQTNIPKEALPPQLQPASSVDGFFQDSPIIGNQFIDDEALQRALKLFVLPDVLDDVAPSLQQFGARVLSHEVMTALADAERHPPYLISHSTWGRPISQLVTSSGWRTLQAIGISEGIVAIAYERRHGAYSRLLQFTKNHLWSASDATVTCPSAMTDGAAKLLTAHARGRESKKAHFARAVERLISRDPKQAWTSGQWMTERAGGSNVRETQTVATRVADSDDNPDDRNSNIHTWDRGPWQINGFKWFSSATDADMAILLAQTDMGLSAFYAPMWIDRSKGLLNGISIQRLKNKLGTKALPTAELELKGMRAHLIGEEGKGVQEISTILNVTRIYNAVSALGGWGRGLAIARAFAKVRKAKGDQRLVDVPAHVATLAEQMVLYHAWTLLTYFVVGLLGRDECPEDGRSHHIAGIIPSGPDSKLQISRLLRLLTPVIKAGTAKAAIHGLQECMEALGGVGYLENDDPLLNIARLYRDANVLSIWEGTTNIMADDLVRVLKGRDGLAVIDALDEWLQTSISTLKRHGGSALQLIIHVSEAWKVFKARVDRASADQLRLQGRSIMQDLGWLVSAMLLIVDASQEADQGQEEREFNALEIARHFVDSHRNVRDASNEELEQKLVWQRRTVAGSKEISQNGQAKL